MVVGITFVFFGSGLTALLVLIFAATLRGKRMAGPLVLDEPFTREDR